MIKIIQEGTEVGLNFIVHVKNVESTPFLINQHLRCINVSFQLSGYAYGFQSIKTRYFL